MLATVLPMTSTYDNAGHFFISDAMASKDVDLGSIHIPTPASTQPRSLLCERAMRLSAAGLRALCAPFRLLARLLHVHTWRATPLFAALVVIEATDIVFAADSLPAVLSITTDPFVAYTSNIFAILGLRALYFALAAAMSQFKYLAPALGVILLFIGAKLLGGLVGIHCSVETTLAVVLTVLAVAVVLSIRARKASPESTISV
jgi:hypothetical protein